MITSDKTPWNDLRSEKAGINIATEDNKAMVDAIQYFMEMDQDVLQQWGVGARQYALHAVDMEKIRKQYELLFSC